MRRGYTVVSLTGLLALTGLFFVPGLGQEPSVPRQGDDDTPGSGASPAVLTAYAGGAVEGVRKVAQDAPTTTTSIPYVNLPGAAVRWFVPARDTDLLNVGFSGECRLINSANTAANQDWVGMRALITAAPAQPGFPSFMEPYSDPLSPMAFCSENSYAMHHANWTRRVSGGTTGVTYTVQIQWKVTQNLPATAGLQAWLDDWKLELIAFN